ncbi:DUF1249 family protein [Vibrio methylphosphonaticus]|uniref:DUF1249 family protein n=1 Tax=Vibrio methylphosphonaticus TaxID=2946866 RepID=UPI002029D75D|nr:DUF1249 family protein [Vibrio methylphosphonaticus]MCL9775045.1 DUF1249 family protein [Vibrio methylphosphonaticus]
MATTRQIDGKAYHVDLAELMRVYETNYAKLNRLIPTTPDVGDVRCYQAGSLTYQIEIVEVTKYTTLVEICQDDELPVFPLPKMVVRLYHDAKVAEVCHCEQTARVKARYDYPNTKMLQKDEKFQFNQFLSDWLTFCLKNGISRAPIMYRS